MTHIAAHAFHALQEQAAIVIPVYFPSEADAKTGEPLLRDLLFLLCQSLKNPAMICLSVDGRRCGEESADRLAREFGASLCVSPVNRGKLYGVAHGMRFLLERYPFEYIAVMDQDGDHFANDLLNFIRAAEHIAAHARTKNIMLTGRRVSRHHSMGLLRGEIEELCDRMLLDALHYHAVIAQRPLRLECVNCLEEFPDFHSGYHLFSRAAAEAVFLAPPEFMGLSETRYYRHACDAVMVVEAIERGAYFGVVNRSGFFEQPLSTFGRLNRVELATDMIAWPCRRLEIPLPFVAQWLANHIPRLRLHTLAPQGKDELEAIRQAVLREFAQNPQQPIEPLFEPLFL